MVLTSNLTRRTIKSRKAEKMQQILLQRIAQKSQGSPEKQKRKPQRLQQRKPQRLQQRKPQRKKLQNKKKQDLKSEFLLFQYKKIPFLIKRPPLILRYFKKDSELENYISFIFRNKISSPPESFPTYFIQRAFSFSNLQAND